MNVPTVDLTQLRNSGNPWPFVDPLTAKKDCNVAKTAEALFHFNHTKLTAKETRHMGGAPGPVPTGNRLTTNVFEAAGMVRGTDFITANPKPLESLKQLLREGWYVGLYVDYGVLNRLGAKTGDHNYTGLHCVGLWGWRRSLQGRLVWDHDPLFDGRRPRIPFGRQHVPFGPLMFAAQAAVPQQIQGAPASGLWTGWAVKIPL